MTEEQEIKMYGSTVVDMQNSVENSLSVKIDGAGGYPMVVASMMSDAQELIAMGQSEEARQMLNCAKWVLFTYIMKRR